MASYPSAVKTFVSRNAGDVIQPAHMNDLQDEVSAIEAGLLNGTAPLNSSNSTVAHLSVTGGLNVVGNSTLTGGLSVSGNSTFGSSITIGGLPYIFPSSGGSTGQALVISSTSGSTMTVEWRTVVGQLTLVGAATGTFDPNAAAANVATAAVSGLTVTDRLVIDLTIETDQTAAITIVSVTDSNGVIVALGNAAAANNGMWHAVVSNAQSATTKYKALVQSYQAPGATAQNILTEFTATTAWTGSWTIGLRHAGGGVAGTCRYSLAIYKLAGQ